MTLADADAHRRRTRRSTARHRRATHERSPCPSPGRPQPLLVEPIVRAALEEDLGRAGDITSELTIPAEQAAHAPSWWRASPAASPA